VINVSGHRIGTAEVRHVVHTAAHRHSRGAARGAHGGVGMQSSASLHQHCSGAVRIDAWVRCAAELQVPDDLCSGAPVGL